MAEGRARCTAFMNLKVIELPCPTIQQAQVGAANPKNTGLRPLLSLCPTRVLAQDLNSPINPTRVTKTKRTQRRRQRSRKQPGLH